MVSKTITAFAVQPTFATHHPTTWCTSNHDVGSKLFGTSLDQSYVQQQTATVTSTPPPAGITPIQQFEPVLNVEAAASFALIAIVFSLLLFRINSISNAALRRSAALEALRTAESLQLSASDTAKPSEEEVRVAKLAYANALKEELNLRTIIPGVRIVAPNDPKRDKEERAAAKRFLGWGSDEFGDDLSEEDEVLQPSLQLLEQRRGEDSNVQGNEDDGGLTNSAKLILAGVATMLIILLGTLSFDPMVADQVFTTVDGMIES